jgi:pilus assembly protein CpaC
LREVGFNFWNKKTKADGHGYAGGLTAPSNGLEDVAPELSTTPDLGELNHGDTGFDSNAPYLPKSDAVPLVGGPVSDTFGFIFSSSLGGFPFSAALSILSRKGYARTLAEPTIVALSGKKATFLAGGEFPIPLPQSLGQIAVEFRKFGIQLEFTPTVIGDDIQLTLAMTVSDVDGALGIKLASTTVPGLTERHSETTVRLKDGQSFVIAGLLSDKVRSSVDKVPWLGDIPVLGTLFRSSSYRREESELLVVVTAHRVAPLSERPLLPGEYAHTDPSDLELFLLGKYESIDTEDDEPQPPKKRKRRQREPVGALGFER